MGQYSRFKYKLIRPGFLNESLQPIENYNKFACEYIEQWLKDNDFKDQKYNWNYMKLQYGVAENWFRQLNPDQQVLEQQKMQEYKQKGNVERVANATKNIGKILYRMHWCEDHNWPEGVDAFKKDAYAAIYAEKQKDIDAIVNKKQQFEYDVNNADLSKYAPTDRDRKKMIDYMNRKSNSERLASSCKDPNKIVSRFIIANCIGWKAAANTFKEKALDEGFATEAELEAFYRKYINEGIPEKWADYIDAQKENLKSGINTIRPKENQIDLRVQKVLDECPNVDGYEYIMKHLNSSEDCTEVIG